MQRCCATLGLSLIVSCGTVAAQQPPAAPSSPPFAFTNVDLDLLHQTNEIDQQIDSEGSLYTDSKLADYVSAVGNDVLPQGLPDPLNVKWQFHVLRDPFPNAFAIVKNTGKPGATIRLAHGGVGVVDGSYPESIHIAYPRVNYQIEVYDPSPPAGRKLVAAGRITRVP